MTGVMPASEVHPDVAAPRTRWPRVGTGVGLDGAPPLRASGARIRKIAKVVMNRDVSGGLDLSILFGDHEL